MIQSVYRLVYHSPVEPGVEESLGSPSTTAPSNSLAIAGREHWARLHRYASEHAADWCPEAARAWLDTWESTIPYCCASNYHRLAISYDCSTPETFFESAWHAHDTVSRDLIAQGKPHTLMSLCDAYAQWWPEIVN
jgi:hypothetical protein